jgi:hypothetical protein
MMHAWMMAVGSTNWFTFAPTHMGLLLASFKAFVATPSLVRSFELFWDFKTAIRKFPCIRILS